MRSSTTNVENYCPRPMLLSGRKRMPRVVQLGSRQTGRHSPQRKGTHHKWMSKTNSARKSALPCKHCSPPLPDIRREVAARKEKSKISKSDAHPLSSHEPACKRLKSRKSSLHKADDFTEPPQQMRTHMWQTRAENQSQDWIIPLENLPPGKEEDRVIWKTLNRLLSGVARTRVNMQEWSLTHEISRCECSYEQINDHLLECIKCPATCNMPYLIDATPNALDVAEYWSEIIWFYI